MPAAATVRVQMHLPPASAKRLEALVVRTEASSYSEVMRGALRLYEAAVAEVEAGETFYVKRNGTFVPALTLVGA